VRFVVTQAELAGLVADGVLTSREADAIFLHDVKGLSYRAIGLGLPVPVSAQAVHQRCRRGHDKIRLWRKEAA